MTAQYPRRAAIFGATPRMTAQHCNTGTLYAHYMHIILKKHHFLYNENYYISMANGLEKKTFSASGRLLKTETSPAGSFFDVEGRLGGAPQKITDVNIDIRTGKVRSRTSRTVFGGRGTVPIDRTGRRQIEKPPIEIKTSLSKDELKKLEQFRAQLNQAKIERLQVSQIGRLEKVTPGNLRRLEKETIKSKEEYREQLEKYNSIVDKFENKLKEFDRYKKVDEKGVITYTVPSIAPSNISTRINFILREYQKEVSPVEQKTREINKTTIKKIDNFNSKVEQFKQFTASRKEEIIIKRPGSISDKFFVSGEEMGIEKDIAKSEFFKIPQRFAEGKKETKEAIESLSFKFTDIPKVFPVGSQIRGKDQKLVLGAVEEVRKFGVEGISTFAGILTPVEKIGGEIFETSFIGFQKSTGLVPEKIKIPISQKKAEKKAQKITMIDLPIAIQEEPKKTVIKEILGKEIKSPQFLPTEKDVFIAPLVRTGGEIATGLIAAELAFVGAQKGFQAFKTFTETKLVGKFGTEIITELKTPGILKIVSPTEAELSLTAKLTKKIPFDKPIKGFPGTGGTRIGKIIGGVEKQLAKELGIAEKTGEIAITSKIGVIGEKIQPLGLVEVPQLRIVEDVGKTFKLAKKTSLPKLIPELEKAGVEVALDSFSLTGKQASSLGLTFKEIKPITIKEGRIGAFFPKEALIENPVFKIGSKSVFTPVKKGKPGKPVKLDFVSIQESRVTGLPSKEKSVEFIKLKELGKEINLTKTKIPIKFKSFTTKGKADLEISLLETKNIKNILGVRTAKDVEIFRLTPKGEIQKLTTAGEQVTIITKPGFVAKKLVKGRVDKKTSLNIFEKEAGLELPKIKSISKKIKVSTKKPFEIKSDAGTFQIQRQELLTPGKIKRISLISEEEIISQVAERGFAKAISQQETKKVGFLTLSFKGVKPIKGITTIQKQKQAQAIKTIQEIKTIPLLEIGKASKTLKSIKTIQTIKSIQGLKQAKAIKTIQTIKSIQGIKALPTIKAFGEISETGFISDAPPPKIPLVLFPTIQKVKKTGVKKRVQGYNAIVFQKGKPVKVTKKSVPINKALNRGLFVTDNTASARFKIVKTKTKTKKKDTRLSTKIKKFTFNKKRNNYIEKRNKRIDTSGEKKGITAKGLLALERKRKKINKVFF